MPSSGSWRWRHPRFLVLLDFPVLRALERQVVHQPFVAEDEADDRVAYVVGVDLFTDAEFDQGNAAVYASFPTITIALDWALTFFKLVLLKKWLTP